MYSKLAGATRVVSVLSAMMAPSVLSCGAQGPLGSQTSEHLDAGADSTRVADASPDGAALPARPARDAEVSLSDASGSADASGSTDASDGSSPGSEVVYNAYLAAYFVEKKHPDGSEDSQLYYAIARDGFQFSFAVNEGRPILASTMDDKLIRDPMIMRDPDGKRFHLIATVSWTHRPFTLWDSTNLIHWQNERLIDVAPPNSTATWAPALLWDPDTRQYIVYWTGVTGAWKTASIRYATSTDLETFSAPQVLMQESDGCLDADILFANGSWHMVYRFTGIWKRTARTALGPYGDPVKLLDLDVEGPAFFPVNHQHDQWGLTFDYFGGNQGRWGMALSSNMAEWKLATTTDHGYYTPSVFFPPGVRHGNVLPISDAEADAILDTFGATKYDYMGHAQ